MTHWKLSPQRIGLIMAYLLLAACSTSQAPLSPVPPSATPQLPPTPIPATDTPTPSHPFFSKDEILEIPSISVVVGEGEISFSKGEEPETISIKINGTIPVVDGKVCPGCVEVIRIDPDLKVSTRWFTGLLDGQGVSMTLNLAFGGPLIPEDASEFIVSGDEGATLKKEGGGFLLEEGEAYLLTELGFETASDAALAEDPTDSPKPVSATTAPLPDTPTPLPIKIRVRMDNNPNGEINIEVMEGEYQLEYGTTLRAGSSIWEEEQYLKFPVGLAIEAGQAGLTLKGKDYPPGTLLFVEKEDQLTIVGEAGSGEEEETASGLVDEMDCQTDDGSQRNFYSLDSAFISHEVQIDGKISSADEWSTASCVDLRFHEGNNYDSPNVRQVRWWVQNNGQNIYFLARVPKDLSTMVTAVLYFWPEYTGSWAHSDNTSVSIEGEYQDQSGWDEAQFYEDVKLSPPGSVDGEGAVSEDGEFYWFEIKKDLDSGDSYDWALEPGQTIGSNPSDSLLVLLGMEDSYFTRSLQMRVGESR